MTKLFADYEQGLDILGAGMMLPRLPGSTSPSGAASQGAANAQKAQATAAKMSAAAGKLAAKGPKGAESARALAAKALKVNQKGKSEAAKAKTALTKQAAASTAAAIAKKISVTPTLSPTATRALVSSPQARAVASHVATAAPAMQSVTIKRPMTPTAKKTAQRILGDIIGDALTMQYDPSSVQTMMNVVNAGNAVAQAGDIEAGVIDLGNKLPQTATDLVTQAQGLVDRCDQVINNFDPDNPDPSIPGTVSGIAADAATWTTQANAAIANPNANAPFDPGTSGGGGGSDTSSDDGGGGAPSGGGGGEDDGGGDAGGGEGFPEDADDPEAQAIADFRRSGGESDPLADAEWGDDAEAPDDTAMDEADANSGELDADDDVMGVDFQWTDIFFPWQAAQRKQEEDDAKRNVVADQPGTAPASAALSTGGTASSAATARLTAAQRKLAQMRARRAQSSAAIAQRAQAAAAQEAHDKAALEQRASDASTDTSTQETVMGFPIDDADDLLLHHYEWEITDEAPDVQRRRGSVHRGAGYLQPITYPPFGASSGQQGGTMNVEDVETIEVNGDEPAPASAYDVGCDVLGAQVTRAAITRTQATKGPKAGFALKKTPAGRKITSMVFKNPKGHDHKSSIQNARLAGARAIKMAGKLQAGLAKMKKTSVHGLIAAHRAQPKGKKGHYANMSLAQLQHLATEVAKTGKSTLEQAGKHEKYVGALKAKDQAAISAQRRSYSPSGKKGTRVTGCAETDHALDVLGAALDAHSQDMEAEAQGMAAADELWSQTSGDVLLGDNYTGPMDDGTGDTGTVDDGSGDTITPGGPPDYGLGAPPTVAPPLVAGQDYIPGSGFPMDQALAFTGDLPAGCIIYDKGLKPWKWQSVGSYTRFNPAGDNSDGHGESGFQWGGGNPSIMDGWYWWWHGATSGTEYKHENDGNYIGEANGVLGRSYGAGAEVMKDRQAVSVGLGWGPIIGNPSDPDFKGLRYDSAGDRWFWFYDEAPAWAKVPSDQARLNQAILDYHTQVTAAAADAAAAALQDKLDQEAAAQQQKQQAAEDSQQQHQLDMQQRQAEQDANTQQLADQADAAAQAAADESYQRQSMADADASAAAYRQMQEADDESDKRFLEYARQVEQQDGGGDDGGYVDDGGLDTGDSDGLEQDPLEEVLGHLRGSDRHRVRRAAR